MPYTAIPTISTGDVLTASFLNGLSSNQEFLHSLGNSANTPFNSHRSTQATLDTADAQWFVRHRLDYLHYRVLSYGGNWNYARVYYNGWKVASSETAAASLSGSVDLTDPSTWPNHLGAWALTTAYEDDVNGDGAAGNGDDGHIVSNGGSYYRCILAHTSAATDEPGVGVNWTTYWSLITLPAVGDIVQIYADVNFNSGTEVGVEYFFEADSASL